jgi:CHASE3 domain
MRRPQAQDEWGSHTATWHLCEPCALQLSASFTQSTHSLSEVPVSPANAKTFSLLAWSIGLTALLAAILSAAIVWLVEREHTETDLVRHSPAVNSQISEVSLFVQRMETNQRGYLLTARDLYLSNFSDLEKALPALIDETVKLLDGDQRHDQAIARQTAIGNPEDFIQRFSERI